MYNGSGRDTNDTSKEIRTKILNMVLLEVKTEGERGKRKRGKGRNKRQTVTFGNQYMTIIFDIVVPVMHHIIVLKLRKKSSGMKKCI